MKNNEELLKEFERKLDGWYDNDNEFDYIDDYEFMEEDYEEDL